MSELQVSQGKNKIITMKRSVILLNALLICTALAAQTGPVDELFARYKDRDGFTSVYISGKMLGMLGSLDSEEHPDNLLMRISSINILTQDSLSTEKVNFYTELSRKLDFSKYEELMAISEKKEVTKFLIRQSGKTISELLVITGGEGSNTLISIRGEFNLKEISELSRTIGVKELDQIKDAEKNNPQR